MNIAVIGAGVVGLSCAYYAARAGHKVTVIERHSRQRDGCSFGNAGLIVPSHFIPLAAPGMVALGLKWMWNPESPFYVQPRLDLDLISWAYRFWRAANPERAARAGPLLRDLNFASRACFEEFARLPGCEFGYAPRGLLMLCKHERTLDHEIKAACQAEILGIPSEVLDPRETAALDPAIDMDIAGAVYFPKDSHLSPAAFMAALEHQLDAMGVEFVWNSEVIGWRKSGSRVIALRTLSGDIAADEYLLCAGSWSPATARDLDLNLPMQAGKGYSLTLENPPQLPRISAILTEARIAVTPIGSALRFGGTMEIAGLDERINPVRVRGIVKSIPGYYPRFTPPLFEKVQPWRGLRPCSPDGLPYVGRTRRYANLSIATGHAMMGLSLGPITGKLVAQILDGRAPEIDIRLLDPDRYGSSL